MKGEFPMRFGVQEAGEYSLNAKDLFVAIPRRERDRLQRIGQKATIGAFLNAVFGIHSGRQA